MGNDGSINTRSISLTQGGPGAVQLALREQFPDKSQGELLAVEAWVLQHHGDEPLTRGSQVRIPAGASCDAAIREVRERPDEYSRGMDQARRNLVAWIQWSGARGSAAVDKAFVAGTGSAAGFKHGARHAARGPTASPSGTGEPTRAAIGALADQIADLHRVAKGVLLHGEQDRAIGDAFCGLGGAELDGLKVSLALRRDAADMTATYKHLDQPTRGRVLEHFVAEAAKIPAAEREIHADWDVDDTIQAALNDERYPKGTAYPGVTTLQRVFALGPKGQPNGNLAILTGQPDFREASGKTGGRLDQLGVPPREILSGGPVSWVPAWAYRELGLGSAETAYLGLIKDKVSNFRASRECFPERSRVFFGDNGEGDEAVGRTMLQDAPGEVRAVFIHNVTGRVPAEVPAGMTYFDTYAGAAAEAFERGIITAEAMVQVAQAAEREHAAVAWESDEQRTRMDALMARDLARVERLRAEVPSPA
jgi:hypothetical protein